MTDFFLVKCSENVLELVLAEGEEVIQEDGVGQLQDGQSDDNVEGGDDEGDDNVEGDDGQSDYNVECGDDEGDDAVLL